MSTPGPNSQLNQIWMYQIPAQVVAIFFFPWEVQVVMMTSSNLNLIHDKIAVSIY